MVLDLTSAIELTASAATAIVLISLSLVHTPRQRLRLGVALAAWFAVVVALGASRALSADAGIGTPGLGLAVVLPVLALTGLTLGTASGRDALFEAPVPALIGLHTIRLLGATFVLLHATGRLPAPFAPVAGWGDILIGTTAPFVAWMLVHGWPGSRRIALIWNSFGILDLLAAISLGATSAPGPLRLFAGAPSSAIMTDLPWLLIPGFLVPLLFATHLGLFVRLTGLLHPRHRTAVA